MNTFQTIILISLIGNMLIGGIVLGLNPHRKLNRYFFVSTLFITFWLLCMLAVSVQFLGLLLFWTKQVSAAALLLPLGFYILRLVIMEPELKPFQLWYRLRYHLAAALAVGILCQTPFFAESTSFAGGDGSIPVSAYGWGVYPFIAYFVMMSLGMVLSIRKTFAECSGIRLIESQFLLLGWFTGFTFGVVVFVVGILSNSQEITQFLPLFALILDGFVAYGIATRRILSVSEVLQRVVAYVLVAVLLGIEYLVVLYVGRACFDPLLEDAAVLSQLLAVLAVAFSVVPLENWMQLLSRRMLRKDLVSTEGVLARAGGIIREVAVEDELVPNFVCLVCEAFAVPQACLLRVTPAGELLQLYPAPATDSPLQWEGRASLLELLRTEQRAVTVSTLQRMRSTPMVRTTLSLLQGQGWDLVVGGFIRGHLRHILLLKVRKSERIYDLRDQRALQILCDQFAVALENSNLYTEVQNARIYNEILLDALTSGIVAIALDGRITVINQIAQQITGLTAGEAVGQAAAVLPAALAEAGLRMLQDRQGFTYRDIQMEREGQAVPLRLSGAPFHSHTGRQLGVLLVFTDMSELKEMEEQVRRSDRLSSIGTLSAGMAHEIKNPLVTIKTFTQLLPEQYDQAAFRETFFDLVGQEVKRIDTLVNRLLRFARPVKGNLQPAHLHDTVQEALRLVDQQMSRTGITLRLDLHADDDQVQADSEQLNQAFVNLFLNAMDAMPDGGQLVVATRNGRLVPDLPFNGNGHSHPCVELSIQDTGTGIAEEDLHRIFDPFFTRKDRGFGLGLSVTHGIIQEHHATIHVESRVGSGTIFVLRFPLLSAEPPAMREEA